MGVGSGRRRLARARPLGPDDVPGDAGREPAFARAIHIESVAAGDAALERRAQIFALFTDRTRRIHELARSQERSLPELPDEVFQLHTGGMDELIREQLRTRGADRLAELIEPLIAATLALLGDAPG